MRPVRVTQKIIGVADIAAHPLGVEYAGLEPWLDHNQAALEEMLPEAHKGTQHPIDGFQVSNRAEQTHHNVVLLR